MDKYLLFIPLALVLLLFVFWLGYKINSLKNKSIAKDWEGKLLAEQTRSAALELQKKEEKENYLAQIEKLENDLSTQAERLRGEREELRIEKDRLQIELTQRNSEYANLAKKAAEEKEEIQKIQVKFKKEFENLANKILEQKSEKFTSLNKVNIEGILLPLQKKIKDFEEKVEKNRDSALQRHAELGQQLEQLNRQNLKISQEALNLTRALKGETKTQGNWGEMILEKVLEHSGLEKDREYSVQNSFTHENNKRVRPDVIVHLPDNKKMIIDAKVSLTAYEAYVNSTTPEEGQQYLSEHLASVKRHIHDLSGKNYQQIYAVESPDFVLLFIPIEAAFAAASQTHPNLYAEAFDQNIILVTPTTLLAVLKTIDSMWQNEKQKQNTLEIATRAGKLYDSFVNLLSDLEKLGQQLNTVQKTYDSTLRKLSGRNNLIKKVEKLRLLGAKVEKQIDEKLLE